MKRIWIILLFFVFCFPSFAQVVDKLQLLRDDIKSIAYERNQQSTASNQKYDLLSLLQERQLLINELLEKNPQKVIPLLFTAEDLKLFSAQEKIYLEKNIQGVSGEFEIRAALGKFTEYEQYVLRTSEGIYDLYFSGKLPLELKTGAKITVRDSYLIKGIDGENKLILHADEVIIDKPAQDQLAQDAFGVQKTIVFLVNFQNAPSTKPWTADQVKDSVFNTVNSKFKEFSYNQTTVEGQVYGYYTLAVNSSESCSSLTSKITTLTEAAANSAGISLSQYMRRVYIFPKASSCSWAGLGTVGRTGRGYSESWINNSADHGVIAHEMGHNLTLRHSRSLTCSNGTSNQGACSVTEYGDIADTMGGNAVGHYNAYQKEILGWLGYNVSPPITTVTTNGTYTIDNYETVTNNSKALKILKNVDADGSSNYYYLEFRQPIGFDSVLSTSCSNCDIFQGVLVHQGNSKNTKSSDLLDMTPTDNNSKHVALLPGMTFKDTTAINGGVSIKVNSISSGGASVTVTFGNQNNCVRNAPMVYYSPYAPQTVNRGQVTTVTITVVNNDSAECPDTTFNITSVPKDNSLITQVKNSTLIAKANGGRVSTDVLFTPSASAPAQTPLFATTTIKDSLLDRPQWFTTQITVNT